MIRINRETDYGIVMLVQMDRHGAARAHAARQVAGWIGISLPMASKILKGLARAGLVESNRGAKGGYTLARPVETISISDVISALEGPIGLVECVAHPGSCEQESCCPTSVNWKRVNQVLEDALGRVPISEMVAANGDGSPSLLRLESRPARG